VARGNERAQSGLQGFAARELSRARQATQAGGAIVV